MQSSPPWVGGVPTRPCSRKGWRRPDYMTSSPTCHGSARSVCRSPGARSRIGCDRRWPGIGADAVIYRLHRAAFLRPRERLYQLLALQAADRRDGLKLDGADSVFDRRTITGYVGDLERRGLLVRDQGTREERFR